MISKELIKTIEKKIQIKGFNIGFISFQRGKYIQALSLAKKKGLKIERFILLVNDGAFSTFYFVFKESFDFNSLKPLKYKYIVLEARRCTKERLINELFLLDNNNYYAMLTSVKNKVTNFIDSNFFIIGNLNFKDVRDNQTIISLASYRKKKYIFVSETINKTVKNMFFEFKKHNQIDMFDKKKNKNNELKNAYFDLINESYLMDK